MTVTLGKTDAPSTDALVDRYALIASQPEGPEARVREVLGDLVVDSLVRGAALGLVPIVIWLLLGPAAAQGALRAPAASDAGRSPCVLSLVVIAVVVAQPWANDETRLDSEEEWQPLATFLGPDVPLPEELDGVEVRGDVTTSQTRRLIESAVGTYDEGKTFYRDAAEAAADLELRQPEEGETVVLLIADRHDNIGMDRGRPRGRRRGRCRGRLRRRRRHLDRQHLGGVLARLAGRGLRRRSVRRQQVGGDRQPRPRLLRRRLPRRPRLDHARRRGGRRSGRDPAARGRRPALERARELARRDRAQLRRGRRPAGRRGLRGRRGRRPDHHDPGPRREHGRRRRWSAAAPTWSSAATSTSRAARPR